MHGSWEDFIDEWYSQSAQRSDLSAHRQFGPNESEIYPGQVERPRTKRIRLYPRSLDVLQRLSGPGAKIVWSDDEGRYRIDGGKLRRDTVIPRSIEKLIRAQAVRRTRGEHPTFLITDVGRRLVRKHDPLVANEPTKGTEIRRLAHAVPQGRCKGAVSQ
jgi:hypothetical protein